MKKILVSILVIILIVTCAIIVLNKNHVDVNTTNNEFVEVVDQLTETENKANSSKTSLLSEDSGNNEFVDVADYPTETEIKADNPEITSVSEDSDDYVILYYRFILNREPGVQSIDYQTDGIEDTEENRKKYSQPYYTYHSDGFMRYIEEPKFKEEFFDTHIDFKNLSKFSISKKYELMPRTIEFNYDVSDGNHGLFDFERKIRDYYTDKNVYANYQPDSCRIDLNGDGDYLYIKMRAEKVEISEGNYEGSWVSINYDAFDKDGNHIDTLVSNLYPSDYIRMEDNDAYSSLKDVDTVNCLDIDNDSKMELIIEVPGYEFSTTLYIYKYENGKLIGETGVKRFISA